LWTVVSGKGFGDKPNPFIFCFQCDSASNSCGRE
jgi:hypothetical protein